MKCLILAAGQGSRLSDGRDCKPLVRIGGLPIIERVVLSAKAVGAETFHVVTGCYREHLEAFLQSLKEQRGLVIQPVVNCEWERGNGWSVLRAKEHLDEGEEPFLLLMGDHLVSEELLLGLLEHGLPKEVDVVLAVDRDVAGNGWVDPLDVTKVLVGSEGKIQNIGKDLSHFNAFDTGCFLCNPRIFAALEKTAHSSDDSLSAGVRLLAEQGRAAAYAVERGYWIDVDTPEQLQKAKRLLRLSLAKPTDGPIARFVNRPLSTRITWLLGRWQVPPLALTLLAFVVAALGALLMFFSGYLPLAFGGLLVQVASVLDGCDGELARLHMRTSEFGGWLDSILDRYADALIMVGLTYHAWLGRPDWLVLGLGLAALVGALVNTYSAVRFDQLLATQRAPGSWWSRLRIGRDVRLFLVFLGSLANMPLVILGILAILMNGEVVRRALILRGRLRVAW